MYLQKAKDAKRIYASLLHSKSNSDGYKEQGELKTNLYYFYISLYNLGIVSNRWTDPTVYCHFLIFIIC